MCLIRIKQKPAQEEQRKITPIPDLPLPLPPLSLRGGLADAAIQEVDYVLRASAPLREIPRSAFRFPISHALDIPSGQTFLFCP